jgi:trehalose utilization protein
MQRGVWTRFGLLAVGVMLAGNLMAAEGKKCVVVWSEGTAPKDKYPHDINGAVADGLKSLAGWEVVTANLSDPDQGLPDSLLNRCDVLVWWGHKKHQEVSDELTQKIVKRVKEDGMGFVALHSAHFAKPNVALMSIAQTKQALLDTVKPKGRVAAWGAYVNDCTDLKVTTLAKDHPIAQGVPAEFNIVHTERYDNPYAVPTPEQVVFDGVYTKKDGDTVPSQVGFVWHIGKGKLFYFQIGHETNLVFFDANVRKIIGNSVRWAAPEK